METLIGSTVSRDDGSWYRVQAVVWVMLPLRNMAQLVAHVQLEEQGVAQGGCFLEPMGRFWTRYSYHGPAPAELRARLGLGGAGDAVQG